MQLELTAYTIAFRFIRHFALPPARNGSGPHAVKDPHVCEMLSHYEERDALQSLVGARYGSAEVRCPRRGETPRGRSPG